MKEARKEALWNVREVKCVTSEEEVSNLKDKKWILLEIVSTDEGLQYVMGLI